MPELAQVLALLAALLLLAYCFAMLEIQIEGSDGGWAANLPTWRIEKHWLLDVFFGGRPLTGYHAWALSFMLLMFHFPLLLVWQCSWALEARIMGSFMAFWIVEDFLWFLLNPGWGWKRFTKAEVRWHKHWLLGFPTDYWTFAAVSAILLALSYGG